MAGLRAAISAGRLADFIAETRANWIEGESA
jgi:queuine tRNA-ribosyltransferase